MYFTKTLFFFLFLFSHCLIRAQDDIIVYWQPAVALNYDVATNYSHNLSLSNRNYLVEGKEFVLRTRQIDIAHFSKLKIRDNQSLGLGLQYRFRETFEPDKANELRITEQYNLTWNPRQIRWGFRFRVEQRLIPKTTIHRFRSRLAVDGPLEGERLDPGESYFVSSFENLLSMERAQEPQHDLRLTLSLGWLINADLKIQSGIEYRLENYTKRTQPILFLLTAAIFSL
ncbi:MAG: DUF2490 domain-containing protein [Flavobacteriaceae bacterium]